MALRAPFFMSYTFVGILFLLEDAKNTRTTPGGKKVTMLKALLMFYAF
jgi:hypothetical protein